MISVTQLEYILAVELYRHFGKAASSCSVSQPSLSIQIQKAEDEIGYLLFDRDKKPIEPTAKGTLFIHQARVVYAAHQKLIFDATNEKGEVRGNFELAIIPTIMPFLLPLFITKFSTDFSHVNLRVREFTTEMCINSLKQGTLDAAILAGPLGEKGIKETKLYYEKFYLYANANSPLLKKEKIDADDIKADQLWSLMDGHCFKDQVLAYCSIEESTLQMKNVKLLGGSLETLRRIVNSTWGYTLIPEMMLSSLQPEERISQTRAFATPVPTREISLVFAREQWKSDILKALESTILESLPPTIQNKSGKQNFVLDVQGHKV